jgi:hydrogenase expression/formation protein HypC
LNNHLSKGENMCLAVPVKVKKVNENETARVEVDGVKLNVGTILVDNIKEGDWVLVHAGFIIEKLTDEVANEKIELFKEFYEKTGREFKTDGS